MLGWFSTGLEIAITMFHKKDHNLFLSFEIIVNFQMQESSSDHWEVKT